jgi:hypothetical protein
MKMGFMSDPPSLPPFLSHPSQQMGPHQSMDSDPSPTLSQILSTPFPLISVLSSSCCDGSLVTILPSKELHQVLQTFAGVALLAAIHSLFPLPPQGILSRLPRDSLEPLREHARSDTSPPSCSSLTLAGGAIALAFQDAVWRYCKETNLPIRRIR